MAQQNQIALTETHLRRIVKNVVHNIMNESKSIKSKKLQDIVSKHGGFDKYSTGLWSVDLHNLSDADIIGVFTKEQFQAVENYPGKQTPYAPLNSWARENGYAIGQFDYVAPVRLRDGNFLLLITRDELRQDGNELAKKRWSRERNRYWDDFFPTTNRGKAARDLRTNYFYWAHKHGELNNPQSGWSNPERRKQAMDYARQGKDTDGYDAIDHYRH